MDKNAVNDLVINGILAADDVYQLKTSNQSVHFTFKFFLPTIPVHYIQSTGRYLVHIRSDASPNSFYQYFVPFSDYFSFSFQNFKKKIKKRLTMDQACQFFRIRKIS